VPTFSDTLQSALGPGYALERELTGGGMSRVFVATEVSLGRKVVVKVLPPELAAGVNHERFRREIQVAAQLQHPHVVPLLSAGEQGSLIWYTMPYINGHSLREALARGERFAVRDVVRILRDVAEALDYAHGLGVIHRDIKPGNVLLLGSHALVTDFGVSKAISASMPTSGFTSAGMAIGTPAYMAPEQIAADPAADHRMDLYALGLLAYEMLTGEVPFKEDSPQKTMAAQLTRDPSPVERSRADVPAALSALVRRLLAKLPEDRPQLASAVVAQLDEIALSSGGSLAPLKAAPAPSRGRVALVAAVAVAVVATAWVLGQRTGGETVGAFVRDSLLAAESSQVMAPAAAVLTREDSMAIARAVASRMSEVPAPARTGSGTAGRARDSVAIVAWADSLRTQIQRIVLDSLLQVEARRMRFARVGSPMTESEAEAVMAAGAAADAASAQVMAMSGPSGPAVRSGEPRRVVIALPRSVGARADLNAIATALADSLRRRIDGHARFVVVPADSVAAVLRESRTVNTVQERLDADVIVSIALIPARDSVVRMIQMRDLAAAAGFNYRAVTSTVPLSAPTAGLRELMPQVMRSLVEMERGVRPPPSPNGDARPEPDPRRRPTEGSRRRP
jgi:eukaryotic-like serine/threonine-protein kinase